MTRFNKFVRQDSPDYPNILSKAFFINKLLSSEDYIIYKYLCYLRAEEWFTFIMPNRVLMYYYKRKKNRLGTRINVMIPAGCFGENLKIWHIGSIIINPKSRIGKNCIIHGNCCIGSNGGFPDHSPIIGDNVDIGQNAQILGDIKVADGVRIGAGAIVTKSILTPNVTVVGIPARII